MSAINPALPQALKSDLDRVDAHVVKDAEYDELPEMDETMLARSGRQMPRQKYPMTVFAAIELVAGLALIAFGLCQALEGDARAGEGGRGWFRASARENLA